MSSNRPTDPVLCEGCKSGDHAQCGRQSWCECDCEGAVDALDFDFDPYEAAGESPFSLPGGGKSL